MSHSCVITLDAHLMEIGEIVGGSDDECTLLKVVDARISADSRQDTRREFHRSHLEIARA